MLVGSADDHTHPDQVVQGHSWLHGCSKTDAEVG